MQTNAQFNLELPGVKQVLLALIFLIPMFSRGAPLTTAAQPIKEIILKKLSAMTQSLQKRTESIDEKLIDELNRSDLLLGDNVEEYRILRDKISQLKRQKLELVSRIDLVDRITLQVVTYYNGDDLQSFFRKRINELARNELAIGKGLELKVHDYTLFLIDLKIAVNQSSLRGTELVDFIISYIDENSVLNPLAPLMLKQKQSYSNDIKTESARSRTTEEAGDYVDETEGSTQRSQIVPFQNLVPELKTSRPAEGQPE